MISVIVPVYKVEKYINRCVDSIINQSYSNLEIILVDDGSPDVCPKICDDYAEVDSRVRVIHKSNGGLSEARNFGMDLASGDYIFFVDSDDWLCDNYVLETFIAKAQETNADIIIGKTLHSDKKKFCQDVTSLENYFKTVSCLVAWNKLYKTSILKDERFILGRISEDLPFVSKLLFTRSIAFIDKNTYMYFKHEGSIMHSFNKKSLDTVHSSIDVINYLNMYQSKNISLVEIVKENMFAFMIFAVAIRIYRNSTGIKRKEYYLEFFEILDKENLTNDFFIYTKKGIKELHKGKAKQVLKIIFLHYLRYIEFFSRKKRKTL